MCLDWQNCVYCPLFSLIEARNAVHTLCDDTSQTYPSLCIPISQVQYVISDYTKRIKTKIVRKLFLQVIEIQKVSESVFVGYHLAVRSPG